MSTGHKYDLGQDLSLTDYSYVDAGTSSCPSECLYCFDSNSCRMCHDASLVACYNSTDTTEWTSTFYTFDIANLDTSDNTIPSIENSNKAIRLADIDTSIYAGF